MSAVLGRDSHVAWLAVVALTVVPTAGCGETKTVTETVTVGARPAKTGLGPPKEQVEYGQIKIVRSCRRPLRVAVRSIPPSIGSDREQGGGGGRCGGAGEPVPNYNYVAYEGHRVFEVQRPRRRGR